jgi:putative membrane protein
LSIALVWGIVDGLVGPVARLLSLPLTIMTFGLFTLIVNGVLFLVTDAFVGALHVDNFLWAIAGAAVLSIVTLILHKIVDHMRVRRRNRSSR